MKLTRVMARVSLSQVAKKEKKNARKNSSIKEKNYLIKKDRIGSKKKRNKKERKEYQGSKLGPGNKRGSSEDL